MAPRAVRVALALLALTDVIAGLFVAIPTKKPEAPEFCHYPTIMKEMGTLRRGLHTVAMDFPVKWIRRMIHKNDRVNKRCKYDNSYGLLWPNIIYFNHGCRGMFKLCLDKSQPIRCVEKSFRRIRNPAIKRPNQWTFSNKILSVHHTGYSRHCDSKKNEKAKFSFKDNFFKIDDKRCHGNFKICMDPRKKYHVKRKPDEKQCFLYQGDGKFGIKRLYGYNKVKSFGKSEKCKLNEDFGCTKSYVYISKHCKNKFEVCADPDTFISGHVREAKKDSSHPNKYGDCIIYKSDGLADHGIQRFPHFDAIKLLKPSDTCKRGPISSADFGVYVKEDKKNAVFVKDPCFNLEFLICRTNALVKEASKDSEESPKKKDEKGKRMKKA